MDHIVGTPRTQSYKEYVSKLGLNPDNIPKHVACVMDGNGRWAKKKRKPRVFGHKVGAETIRNILKIARKIGVKYLSVYAFSTENWSRPEAEILFLMKLFNDFVDKEKKGLKAEGVRVRFGGRIEELERKLKEKIKDTEELTKNNKQIQFNIMVNYGGRQEIVDGVNEWLNHRESNELFTLETMQQNLYIPESPDADLWIRSSGESRLSNFMLWQSAYSELVFEETLWPDFTEEIFIKCISKYQERERRFGGI